jgi:hypothetical protein
VIALTVGQTEKPLFEDWVFTIPESNGKAEALLLI